MCDCDLDPVNFCCWTHGTDITMADYTDDCCGYCDVIDWAEDEYYGQDYEDYSDTNLTEG